jgi:hypothetical protein
MLPSEGKRTVRPSAERPTQLVPAPHTTATASGDSVPARSRANVSLSMIAFSAQSAALIASANAVSSTGRSAPAR